MRNSKHVSVLFLAMVGREKEEASYIRARAGLIDIYVYKYISIYT